VRGAFFVDDSDGAFVVLEVHSDHVFRDLTFKLCRVDVDFYFFLFVSPRELAYLFLFHCASFFLLNSRQIHAHGFDQYGVASVDLAVTFEVLSSFLRESLWHMGVIILKKIQSL